MAARAIICQAQDTNGDIISGALLHVEEAGTNTDRAIFTDAALSTASTNPAVADSTGSIRVFINDANGNYKVRLTSSDGATAYFTEDGIDPTKGNFLVYPMTGDQGLNVTSSPTFAGLTLSGNLDLDGNRLILDADADTYIEASTDDRFDVVVGGVLRLRIDPNTADVFSFDGVSFSPTGATVGQALGYPNAADTLEPYTPAGGGDLLAAADETVTGDYTFSGDPSFTGAPDFSNATNKATIRDNLNIYQVDSIADMTALTESELADGDQCEVAYYVTEGDGGGGLFRWDAASTEAVDSGWYFAPNTSDGTGRWVRVDRKAVNVRHFGAQGDGVADAAETTALTAAYDKWVSLMGAKGAQFSAASQVPLVIPAGDYLPDSVLTWSPVGTGAQILCFGTLREIQINPQGARQSYTGLHLAGTADETSAATYGILLDDALSDSVHVQDFIIRDRPTGLKVAATNAGNNNFVNGLIRDCTVVGLHYAEGASNNFVNVHSDGNKKNLLIDGGTSSGEGKFANCRFGNTLARGDDINAHIIGTASDNAVECYFTQCTFTASRNDGRLLSITGVTDAGGGRIRVTTSADHKLFDGWDDNFTVSGTTSYNGTFDASTVNLTVISATVIEYDETFVADETGTLELPPWDLYIESDTANDIADTNDMFFQGGNINHAYIKSALKVQFIGTRLKQSIFLESPDAANKKGVHRVFIVGDARGRAQNSLADVPVAGATAGWVRIGTNDDNGGRVPSDTKFVIETPDTSEALGSNNLPTTQKVELAGDAFRFFTGSTKNFELNDDGTTFLRGKFGIGDSDFVPARALHVQAADPRIRLTDTDGGGSFEITNAAGTTFFNISAAHPMVFQTNNTEAFRINATQDVEFSGGYVEILSSGGIQSESDSQFLELSGGAGIGNGAHIVLTGPTFSSASAAFLDADQFRFRNQAGTEFGRMISNNLLWSTTSAGNGDGVICLGNGTAPTANITDGVQLYAEDVSSSSELKVRDEAGNVTTLSPHNFSLIPEGPSEDMAWSYYSEKDGKRINVDMLKAVRVLERISGEQLVFEEYKHSDR